MAGPAAKEEDCSKNEKTDDSKDLDGGKPEFRLSVCADREEVQAHNDNNHDPVRLASALDLYRQPESFKRGVVRTHVIQTAMLMELGQ